MAGGEVVRRTAGFGRGFEFEAEVTRETGDGFATVREYGHTAWGALARARATAGAKMTARRRRTGFYEGGFEFRTGSTRAGFAVGFAGAV